MHWFCYFYQIQYCCVEKAPHPPMLNITLRTLLHVKPFRLIIDLVKLLRIATHLELLSLNIIISIKVLSFSFLTHIAYPNEGNSYETAPSARVATEVWAIRE
jgi:hypothetical protein